MRNDSSKCPNDPCTTCFPETREIHNFSNVSLTERQAQVLGTGLKFRLSLKPAPEAQFVLQIKDFCRRVRLKDFFADQPQDPDFNPRLYVPTGWNPPRQNPELEDKLFPLRETLRRNFSESKPRWKDNLTRQERTELKELKNNQTVRVLPTDKNLGPALLSTDWVKNETLSHLYDDLS